ncbi:MAG TPA: tRNA (guanosine(37)-N1)-methyltransferase TrmD [Fimbriiglobus sp.]
MPAAAAAIRFDVVTLFPDLFQGFLTQSLLKLAIESGRVTVRLWNLRDWATDKHQKVDDRPFGGGPGMVLMPEPVVSCVEAIQKDTELAATVVMLTPAGKRLTQRVVEELGVSPRILLLCGRYEGFDDRIRQVLRPAELSIGDFVCNGGEVPAMVVIDSVIRLIPGVLGDEQSAADDSHNAPGRIEFPQYTRPRVFRGLEVPDVLLGGNHQAVAKWRDEQSQARSKERNES